ncbi:MAG: phosphatase PAP2 family protein [Clostridia bacterium]|nr:phosphatase PAP2 family protein [Clostridia bacterium]
MTPYFPDSIQTWDVNVLNFIQEHIANPALDVFFAFITHLGDAGILWIITAIVMLFFKKTRKCGITMGVALLLGLILGNGLMKNLFARVRPFNLEGAYGAMKGVEDLLVAKPGDKSFPSGHTLGSFEAAFSLFVWNKKIGIPVIVLAALIGFSRLYLYLHFPTDVFMGVILAALNTFLACLIVNCVYKHIENKKKLSPEG